MKQLLIYHLIYKVIKNVCDGDYVDMVRSGGALNSFNPITEFQH